MDKAGLFSVVRNDRTSSNGLKFKHSKFRAVMQNFFMISVTEHLISLPR